MEAIELRHHLVPAFLGFGMVHTTLLTTKAEVHDAAHHNGNENPSGIYRHLSYLTEEWDGYRSLDSRSSPSIRNVLTL